MVSTLNGSVVVEPPSPADVEASPTKPIEKCFTFSLTFYTFTVETTPSKTAFPSS